MHATLLANPVGGGQRNMQPALINDSMHIKRKIAHCAGLDRFRYVPDSAVLRSMVRRIPWHLR